MERIQRQTRLAVHMAGSAIKNRTIWGDALQDGWIDVQGTTHTGFSRLRWCGGWEDHTLPIAGGYLTLVSLVVLSTGERLVLVAVPGPTADDLRWTVWDGEGSQESLKSAVGCLFAPTSLVATWQETETVLITPMIDTIAEWLNDRLDELV